VKGNSDGTNGTNYWTVNGTTVWATDISKRANYQNFNITNHEPPLCEICSCYEAYLEVNGIQNMIDAEVAQTGFASFVVTMFESLLDLNSQLCYGVPNRFLSVLVIGEVEGPAMAQDSHTLEVNFTITSESGRSVTRSENLTTGKLLNLCGVSS